MTDVRSLENSIEQYEEQLSQVQLALSATAKGPERDNFLSLKSDMQELITLIRESLETAKGARSSGEGPPDGMSDDNDDPMAKEYAMFKAELEQASEDTKSTEQNTKAEASSDIEEELKALEGMKCRAPHGSCWGGTGYHNAMVTSIHRVDEETIASINDIKPNELTISNNKMNCKH